LFAPYSSPTGIYFLKEPEDYFSNRWLTTILVNPDETGGVTREDLRLSLADENIDARPLWKPMHLQPIFEEAPCYGEGVSNGLFKYGLCLPSGSDLAESDLERIVGVIKKSLKNSSFHYPHCHREGPPTDVGGSRRSPNADSSRVEERR